MASIANTSHLDAEMLAFAISSETSFELATTTVERDPFGAYLGKSGLFAKALLDHLRPRARGLSLEVLGQLRERLWFRYGVPTEDGFALPFFRFLMMFAHERLVIAGHEVTLRHNSEWPIERSAERWRWLSLALPPDMLIAACAARCHTEPPTDHVSLGSEHLGHFFQEVGIAQAHLHLGAAVPFEWLWTNLMSRIGRSAPPASALDSPGGVPFGTPQAFLDWLVTLAVARITLASFLWHVGLGQVRLPEEQDTRSTGAFRPFVSWLAARGKDEAPHLHAIQSLARGWGPVPSQVLRPVLRRLQRTEPVDPRARRPPRSLEDIRHADPLSAWLDIPYGALPETRLMTRALVFTAEHPGDDRFELLFCQYLRARSRVYRHLVQQPGTAGLDWFSVHFRRIAPLRLDLGPEVMMSAALHLESRGLPLRSLEVRTSPEDRWHLNDRLVRCIAQASQPEEPGTHRPSAGGELLDEGLPHPSRDIPERGLVLHFLKEQDTRGPRKLRHSDPRHHVYGCRYGSYFQGCMRQVMAIEGAIRRHPELLFVLRGVDICSLELAEPTWVFLPLLKRLVDTSRSAASSLMPYGRVSPLRLTLHAGEDFRRLIEGLRRLHEPIEFGVLGPGDRVGHAFALALSPEHWARIAPSVWQPREERLDDLLWELARYRAGDMVGTAGRVDALHGLIDELGRVLYGEDNGGPGYSSVDDLLRARALRHSPDFLRRVGYPFLRRGPRPSFGDHAHRLAWLYLQDFGVYFRGQAPIEIALDDIELGVLHEAQRFLRQLFSRLGITVEANPSSNMLIGDVPLELHPLFRLQPLPHQPVPEGGPVATALGDDDPVTFASSLPDEFCHLFYTLLRLGVGVQDARDWLDQVRLNGLRARFTLPESRVPRHARG